MNRIHSQRLGITQPSVPTFWQRLGRIFQRSAPALGLVVVAALAILSFSLWNRLTQLTNKPTPVMRVIALANTDSAPGATGTLVLDQQGTYGTLVVDNLQTLNADKQYQVWLIKNGERTSGGLFSVNSDGYGSVELWVTQPLSSYDSIGITIEPAGGSPGPTGAKVLGGNISG